MNMRFTVLLLVARCWGASAFAAAVPHMLPGWRLDLVAEASQVNHPSVVCAAPDGRVFVAEDELAATYERGERFPTVNVPLPSVEGPAANRIVIHPSCSR